MNLLFWKLRPNKYYIIWFLLFFINSSEANDSIPRNKFLEYCKSFDAYLQFSYTDVAYVKLWSGYKRYVTVSNKLVINNNLGVDKFAFLNLSEFVSNSLKEIKVNTLKSNGDVIKLDSSLIFKRNVNNKKFEAINYPIPGVEPGDTIFTSYTYTENLKSYEMKDFVNLYSNIPSLNSEYTVKSKPDLLIKYKQYNGFPEPQALSNDSLLYCVFKMEQIKALSENKNMCVLCEFPYLYYSVEKKGARVRTWKDVYNEEFNAVTQPIALDHENSSYYKRWKRQVIDKAVDSSKYYKFRLLHEDIQNNFEMKLATADELIKSNGYFLKKKYFNPLSIQRLYRRLLEDLEIEYSAVFARSKRLGKIDPYYIRMGEYDHIFFAYKDSNGSLNLLYPNDEYHKYQINEIPTSIYDTEAVIVKPYLPDKLKKRDRFIDYDLKMAEVDSVAVNLLTLPGMNFNRNNIRLAYYCDVISKDKDVLFKGRFSLTGGMSTDIRSFFNFLNQNEDANSFYDTIVEFEGNDYAFQIDSVTSKSLKTSPPFNYTVNSEGKVNGAVDFLNNNTISISLENLVQHNQVETELESVDLNYYLDYGYTDYLMIVFNFPSEIKLLGSNDNINFKNDFGEYSLSTKVGVKNTELIVQSVYKITKNVITKEKYIHLKELNDLLKQIMNKRIIIKLNSG